MRTLLRTILPAYIFVALCGVEGCDAEFLARLQAMQAEQAAAEQDASQETNTQGKSFSISSEFKSSLQYLEGNGELVTADECAELIETTPRGFACLHCTQPEAKQQATVLASLLHKSCLKNIAINYLVDGTFDFNSQLLIDHLALLSEGDRTVFVYFYLTNGATARRWDVTNIDAFATKMPPEEFRKAIITDDALHSEYQQLLIRLIPVLEAAAQYGAQVSLVLALEDNLTLQSFNALYDLTIETLPTMLPVSIGRNPCPGCYSGNDATIPTGVFEEKHTLSPHTNVRDGMITNDGRDYNSGELEKLAALRDRATSLNSAFILWSAERQGLNDYENGIYPHPTERNYQMPSIEEQREMVYFLREH